MKKKLAVFFSFFFESFERDKCEDCTNWGNEKDQEEVGSLLDVLSGAVVASTFADTCWGASDSGEDKKSHKPDTNCSLVWLYES